MYIPTANVENRVSVMRELMVAHPLATLVTLGGSGLFASHIPMVWQEDGSEFGVLQGHIARGNAQWKDFVPEVNALAIFAGHQHYISPNWYPEKKVHGKEVPTWNYVVVHAYGPLRVIEDEHWLLAFLNRLTDIHEAASPIPWKVSDAPADFIEAMMHAIVGLEVPIQRLEGKWKVSQNRTESERQGVMEGLGKLDTSASRAMKSLVEDASAKKVSR
ncbi:MAG: FMN-binding negative transcriptional regulator [Terriglobales bacterium]|jgi:transcriptional regulator